MLHLSRRHDRYSGFFEHGQHKTDDPKKTTLYLVNLAYRDGWRGLIEMVAAALMGKGDLLFETDDVYAVGANETILHFNGTSWRIVDTGL
jgi:hypothetical protein